MPLSPILQAGWYRIFGFSLLAMRSLSLLWALLALGCWWFLLRIWQMDVQLSVLAVGMIALDYPFVRSAADGRMDMMCAALNIAALVAYFYLRERRLGWAVFASNSLAALSFFTHPNGIFGFVGICIFAAVFDWRRLRWWYLGIAAVPYLVGLGAWGLYIAEAPDIFEVQFRGNSAGRFWGLQTPFAALVAEISTRYFGGSGGLAGLMKAAQSIPYALGAIIVAVTPTLRRNPALKAVLLLVGFEFVYFWLLEGTKLYLYVVHTGPLFMVLLAAALFHLWKSWRVPNWLAATALGLWVLMQIGGVAFVVRRNNFGNEYAPVARYIEETSRPDAVVMGSAELGFELGFNDRLVDDVKLGAVSGKHPDYVVVEERYREWFAYAQEEEPDTYAHIRQLLDQELRPVFKRGAYQVYARPEAPAR